MSHLLIQLVGNKLFNWTIWPPYLFVHDDMITYKKRSWFVVREMSISYNQIAQVNLIMGLFFGELEIVTTSNDTHTIIINYTNKETTKRAKKIIDQKIHLVHDKQTDTETLKGKDLKTFEKSLSRLKELLEKGRISKKEYEIKRKELLGKW